MTEALDPTPIKRGSPTEVREGDSYVFVWADSGYGLSVTNVVEDREGVDAEVTAFCEVAPNKRVLVHTSRLRLLGTNSKRDFAKHLHELTKSVGRDGKQFDWRVYLEVTAHRTRALYRQGEPIVELADVTPQPQAYLIEEIVPEGRTSLMIGDGSSTKSMQAVAMGLAVVTGKKIGPYRPLKKGPVLYVDAETDEEEQAERAHRIALGVGLMGVPRGFHYQRQLRSLTQSRQGLRDSVDSLGAIFVILDSAGAMANGSLNEDQVAIAVTNALRSLGGVSRLLISHVSKMTAAQDRGRGRAYGNVYFENYARSILEVRREGSNKTDFLVGVYHRKVNRGALRDSFAVQMSFEDPMGPIRMREGRITDSPELAGYGDHADTIVAAIEAAGGAIDFTTLQEETGLKASTLRLRLKAMTNVVQLGAGGGRGHAARYGLRAYVEDEVAM